MADESSAPNCPDGKCDYKTSHDCGNGECSFSYYARASLRKSKKGNSVSTSLEPGTKQVLELSYTRSVRPDVAEDELTLYLRIELPASIKNFDWREDVLSNQEIYYSRQHSYNNASARKPTSGFIKGEKTNNNSWKVEADLFVSYFENKGSKPIRLEFSEVFEPSTIVH